MYDELLERMRSRASWLEFAAIATPSKTDGNGYAILFRKAADAIEELQQYADLYKDLTEKSQKAATEFKQRLQKSEEDNVNLTGWLAEEHANKCPHYIRNVHDRGDDSLCEKLVCEVKSLPKWIPVTERLPETHDYVLCCGAKGGMFVGYISCFTEPQGFAWAWQHGGQGRRIKWWMPLPQPPKDGEP